MFVRNNRNRLTGAKRHSLTVRLLASQDGTAAIEFAIVAPVFMAMMFSLFEVGWYFYANSIVDASVSDAARLVETGQIQKSTGTDAQKQQAIYNVVCNVLKHFGDCSTRLTVEVQTYANFAALAADNTPATCADAPPADVSAIPFNTGGELAIVRVRVCYIYSTVNPAIGVNVSEPGTSKRRLVSSSVFRSEPYATNGSGGSSGSGGSGGSGGS